MADEFTDLIISPDGPPSFSARGVEQTFEPIAVAAPVRTVNGNLVNLAPPQFQKFRSTLTCTDVDPPAFSELWVGSIVSVACIEEVGYLTITGNAPFGRTVVRTRIGGDFTFVRLDLLMMVMEPWRQTRNEAAGTTSWQLVLEEV